MSRQPRIGILGGTFDPIHLGHLGAAAAARVALGLDEVVVIPAHRPPHRRAEPLASIYHRFAMVALAISACPGLVASDVELLSEGQSYTWNTLRALNDRGYAPWQLFFITGADAFAEIATWNNYPAILDLCQFVVISRPGRPVGALRSGLPELAPRMKELAAVPQDSSKLKLATDGERTQIYLVPAATPDVSSTEIRRRVAAGQSLTGLVPSAVEEHIRRHGLYRSQATNVGL